MTQSIIVYRNPAEAALWESGIIIPLGGALVAGLVGFLLLNYCTDELARRFCRGNFYKIRDLLTRINLVLGVVIGIVTFNYLMI